MQTFRIAAAFAALALATPAFAQTQAPPPAQDDAAMHERCQAMMGKQMGAKPPHDHDRDKTGRSTWPQGKKPSKAEMSRLHAQCAERMAKAEAEAAKKAQ